MNLDDDVAAEVERLRRERGIGLSVAVNELARAGSRASGPELTYEHVTFDMGAIVDLSNGADVLELIEEADRTPGSTRAS